MGIGKPIRLSIINEQILIFKLKEPLFKEGSFRLLIVIRRKALTPENGYDTIAK
jgi:hypothetical protein